MLTTAGGNHNACHSSCLTKIGARKKKTRDRENRTREFTCSTSHRADKPLSTLTSILARAALSRRIFLEKPAMNCPRRHNNGEA